MPLIIGVEIVERSSNTNATKKRAVRGVAGRNIANIYFSKSSESKKVELAGSPIRATWCPCASLRLDLVGLMSPADVFASTLAKVISLCSKLDHALQCVVAIKYCNRWKKHKMPPRNLGEEVGIPEYGGWLQV